MTRPILFIGTSFLGAIKQAYDAIPSKSYPATFIGLNAPELAANLTAGWEIDEGVLRFVPDFKCFASGYNHSVGVNGGSKTFPGSEKISGLNIDLSAYRSIVFVDMFYRLRPVFIVGAHSFPCMEGAPVSSELLTQLHVNGFNGWMSLSGHQQYGQISFVNTQRLLTAVKAVAESTFVYLLSSPRPPVGNIDIKARYGDLASANRSYDYLEKFYKVELARFGIEYLAQPLAVLDDDGCLTRAEYSRGPHPTKVGTLDEHMNAGYGGVILDHYLDRL